MHAAVVQLNTQDDVTLNLGPRHGSGSPRRPPRAPSSWRSRRTSPSWARRPRKRELAERLDGAFPGPILGALASAAAASGVVGPRRRHAREERRPGAPVQHVRPRRPARATSPRRTARCTSSTSASPDGTSHRESAATSGGRRGRHRGGARASASGLSVCYDVRFPELYRRLVDEGARIVTVPAAFTLTTGKDHWHVLLRARAIENQVYVLAPGAARQAPARAADVRQVAHRRSVGRGRRAVLGGRGHGAGAPRLRVPGPRAHVAPVASRTASGDACPPRRSRGARGDHRRGDARGRRRGGARGAVRPRAARRGVRAVAGRRVRGGARGGGRVGDRRARARPARPRRRRRATRSSRPRSRSSPPPRRSRHRRAARSSATSSPRR